MSKLLQSVVKGEEKASKTLQVRDFFELCFFLRNQFLKSSPRKAVEKFSLFKEMRINERPVWQVIPWRDIWRGGLSIGADLHEADFCGADLRGADLRKANLREANLRGVDLRGADLRGADFYCANLWSADLRGTDLRGADFSDGIDLYEVKLSGANLSKVNLSKANLYWSELCRANLSEVNLHAARLIGLNLRRLNLRGVNFSEASFTGVDLSEADLRRTNFRRATFCRTNFCRADFRGARLHEVVLRGAEVYKADFRGADLSGAEFTEICFDKPKDFIDRFFPTGGDDEKDDAVNYYKKRIQSLKLILKNLKPIELFELSEQPISISIFNIYSEFTNYIAMREERRGLKSRFFQPGNTCNSLKLRFIMYVGYLLIGSVGSSLSGKLSETRMKLRDLAGKACRTDSSILNFRMLGDSNYSLSAYFEKLLQNIEQIRDMQSKYMSDQNVQDNRLTDEEKQLVRKFGIEDPDMDEGLCDIEYIF